MSLDFSDQQLKYLYLAAKLGTMRAAAESLNIAPSSVSRRIANLETEIGTPLVERGRHRVQLTEAGMLLCEHYKKRAIDHQALLASLEDIRELRKGDVSVAISEGFISNVLAPALVQFWKRYPAIAVRAQMLPTTNEVVDMVVEDEAYFGLVFDPQEDPRLKRRISLAQPLKAVVHPTHPLAKELSIRLRDLVGQPLIFNTNFRFHETIREAAKLEEIQLEPLMTTNSYALLRQTVIDNVGVAILSDLSVAQALSQKLVVSVPIDNPVLKESKAVIVTRLGRRLPVSAALFLKYVEAAVMAWHRLFNCPPERAVGKPPVRAPV